MSSICADRTGLTPIPSSDLRASRSCRGPVTIKGHLLQKVVKEPSTLKHSHLRRAHQSRVTSRSRQQWRRTSSLPVYNLDAAQVFDYEDKQQRNLEKKQKLKIGIIGFGNFGQFIGKKFLEQGHSVLGFSRSDYSTAAKEMGAEFYNQMDDFCEEHPDVVILATSILSTETVLKSIPYQRLRRNTLFCDVLSVKVFPKQLMLQLLPWYFDVCCLHPMFGPQSGKDGWQGLPLVYDRVRVNENRNGEERLDTFLSIWEREGCRMVEMTCEEHDRRAASSQFITHTVGRVLSRMDLEDTDINTKGYESLLSLIDNTTTDSFDLYYGLFMYNPNATEELQRLERAFDDVKSQLFDRLHNIVRQQLFTDGLELPMPTNGSAAEPQRTLPSSGPSGTVTPEILEEKKAKEGSQ